MAQVGLHSASAPPAGVTLIRGRNGIDALQMFSQRRVARVYCVSGRAPWAPGADGCTLRLGFTLATHQPGPSSDAQMHPPIHAERRKSPFGKSDDRLLIASDT